MVKTKKNSENQRISLLLEDLRIMHHYLQAFWSFLPIAICEINTSLIIISATQKFFEFFDYKEEEIVGQGIEKIFAHPGEFQDFKKKLSKEGIVSNQEVTLFNKKKQTLPISLFAQARKENGDIISYFLAFIDLREIKEKERALREKIEELESFQKLVVGRELKMVELKGEIEKLKMELEKSKK